MGRGTGAWSMVWGGLASVWIHLGLLALALIEPCTTPTADVAAPPVVMRVERLPRPPIASTRGTGTGDRSLTADPASVAASAELDLGSPTPTVPTQPASGAPPAVAPVLDASGAEMEATLAVARAMAEGTTPSPSDVLPPATPTVDDGTADADDDASTPAPAHDASTAPDLPDDRGAEEPEVEPATPPRVAEAVATDAPEPRPPDAPPQPVEPDTDEPEPSPPEAEEPDSDLLHYVHAPASAPDESPLSSRWISSRDVRAEFVERTAVVARDEGPFIPEKQPSPTRGGAPAVMPRKGETGQPGGRRAAEPTEDEPQSQARAGGGRDSIASGDGSRTSGGKTREASLRAPRGAGQRSASGQRAVAGTAGTAGGPPPGSAPGFNAAGFVLGPRPDAPARQRADTWWRPSAVRLTPAPTAVIAVREAPQPTRPEPARPARHRRAPVVPVTVPAEARDDGGTDAVADELDEPSERVDDQEGESDADGLDVDLVDSFRRDMKWGDIERTTIPDRRVVPSPSGTPGSVATSPQVAVEVVPASTFSTADARGHVFGRYRAAIDEIVNARWDALDLPLHDRARGIQGVTVIDTVVKRNGRVTRVEVTRSSGHPELDGLALQAIPKRLPRFPREIEPNELRQVFHFNYRNPLIIPSGPRR